MAEIKLVTRSPFGTELRAGRFGKSLSGKPFSSEPPVTISERQGLDIRTISARAGRLSQAASAVKTVAGIELPSSARCATTGGLRLIGTSPGQWLAIAEDAAAKSLLDHLTGALTSTATITDQSHAKAVLRVSGPKARDVFAKGCMIDLHPRVFKVGDAATTPVALIDCLLWQVDDLPSYDLAVPSSYAESFWSWLTEAAAEHGYEVR